jgi:tetratricopeptide (TPR) repeat protein
MKSKPKTKAPAAAQAKEPNAAVVQAELASLDAKQLTARADVLHAQGHTGVSASYYRRALELDPDYAPALVGIGRSILRAKKYSDAMKNASRALQLARGVDARPGLEAAAIYQMGRVHYERSERDAARRLFRQSISLPGTPPEAWFYLGEALSSDNSPAARNAYEEYLELVPESHLAERARRAIQ